MPFENIFIEVERNCVVPLLSSLFSWEYQTFDLRFCLSFFSLSLLSLLISFLSFLFCSSSRRAVEVPSSGNLCLESLALCYGFFLFIFFFFLIFKIDS